MDLCGILISIMYLIFGASLIVPMLIDEYYKHKGSNAESRNQKDQMRKLKGKNAETENGKERKGK